MKCLITGASSGIGRDMARYLSKMGHEIIMVSKSEEKLKKASNEIKNSRIYIADLTCEEEVNKLCSFILEEKPQVVINNAGFGAFGFYNEVDIQKELDMINVNIVAVHKITKVCLEYMDLFDESYILNVASSAGLMPGGPLLNTYYATKSYVRSYTLGVYEELKKQKKNNIHISVLCPGPVNTNFNNVAGGTFSVKGLSSEYVARYGLNKLFKRKMLIVPGFFMKAGVFLSRFVPTKVLLSIAFSIQHKKRN